LPQDVPLTKGLGATQVHQRLQDGNMLAKREDEHCAMPLNKALTCCI
jgi:hypothetical protein